MMNALEMLGYVLEDNEISAEQLDEFIAHNDEGQYLDYKDGLLIEDRRNARETVRQWVNGFANADGGLLVLGVTNSTPHAISPCPETVGKEPLDKWAEAQVHDMAPFLSPLPRFQKVKYGNGQVLVIAVPRAPNLVPYTESRQLKYYLRLNQSTIEIRRLINVTDVYNPSRISDLRPRRRSADRRELVERQA